MNHVVASYTETHETPHTPLHVSHNRLQQQQSTPSLSSDVRDRICGGAKASDGSGGTSALVSSPVLPAPPADDLVDTSLGPCGRNDDGQGEAQWLLGRFSQCSTQVTQGASLEALSSRSCCVVSDDAGDSCGSTRSALASRSEILIQDPPQSAAAASFVAAAAALVLFANMTDHDRDRDDDSGNRTNPLPPPPLPTTTSSPVNLTERRPGVISERQSTEEGSTEEEVWKAPHRLMLSRYGRIPVSPFQDLLKGCRH